MFTKNQIGVASWIFGKRPLAEIIERVVRLNFAGVALAGDVADPAATRRRLHDAGLAVFSLTPSNVDLSHPEDGVRQTAVDHYLALLDTAAVLACPVVVCQGMGGRTESMGDVAGERARFLTAVSHLAKRAHSHGIRLALNVRNRYESHFLHTGTEAMALLDALGADNVGIQLNSFHMNIEEQDAAAVINHVGQRLCRYHVADSNRQAIGRGHLKLGLQLWALENIGYDDPIIIECLPPRSHPLAPAHDEAALATLETYLQESRSWF